MYMKNLFIIYLLLITSSAYSQGNIMYDYRLGYTAKNYFHIFGDKVNIRSAADKNSEVVKQLAIGDSIKVTKITDENLILNGLEYPWVEVEWTVNKQKKTGFIWGALLSFYYESFRTESGVNYSIHLGPLKLDKTSNEFWGEARLSSNGVVLASKTFNLHRHKSDTETMNMGIYKNTYSSPPRSYRTITYILSIDLTVESCGPSGTIYVLVQNDKIIFSGSELGSFSGGDYSEGNYFVFPWDKGGMKENIFEYYSYYVAGEDIEGTTPETDTTYLINTYTKVNEEFLLDKK